MRDQDVFLERALLAGDSVKPPQIEAARRYGHEHKLDLADSLVAIEAIDSRALALVKADLAETPFVDLTEFEICFGNTRLVPRALAERFCLFPVFQLDGVLTLAMDDPLNLEAMDQVRQITKCDVDAVLADRQRLKALIARAYSLGHDGAVNLDAPVMASGAAMEASGPVVAAVNQLLADAAEQGASDIHINPDEDELRLRYRIDGVLQQRQSPPLSMHSGIVQRLKIMANLDLTQTRRPQDGKFRFIHNGQPAEVRMSTVPTVCGENVVLRLLAATRTITDFAQLGISPRLCGELEEMIEQPYGMILVTGPTGSGKTTTLYTALNKLNDPSLNIVTVEDPVEIRLPYLRQIQVHPEIGLTFASALRSILRQDPDVVLVGEIRDEETATIALQAALTGHLVLSTLHTNDAAGAIARLRNYGMPSFVINSAVLGVVAQRLARRVCQHCIKDDAVEPRMRLRFGLESSARGFVKGAGCGRCGQTGYKGRVGLYELLRCSGAIQKAIEAGESTAALRRIAVESGLHLMWQDGLEKARLRQTTLQEVAQVALIMDVEDKAQATLKEAA